MTLLTLKDFAQPSISEVDSIAMQTPEILELMSEVNRLNNSNEVMSEQMSNAMMALKVESLGWINVIGGTGGLDNDGLDLPQLQEISGRCREYASFTDLIKRGLGLRASYIWSKGILIEGPEKRGDGRGNNKQWKAFLEANNDVFNNAESQQEMERLAGTDGNVLFVVPKRSASGRMLVLGVDDIDKIALNPDKKDDIWAYRRKWNSTNIQTGESEVTWEWFVTDRWDTSVVAIPDTLGQENDKHDVSKSHVVVDVRVNRMSGWALGIPDVAAGLPYYREYNNFMKYGSDVAASMSKIVFKVLNKSAAGAKASNVQMSKPGSLAGETVSLGDGQDFQALNTAGRGYDFDSGRSLAARLAASLEVSVIHLLSDPGAAGSSYGSAQNLDLPTKRAMVLRQRTWEDAFRRIFKIVSPKDEVKVQFPPLEDPDPYRQAQENVIYWGTGLFHADEMRDTIVDDTKMKTLHEEAPENVLLPNNSDSWERADIDPKEDPNKPVSANAASPDQGQNSPAGKAVNNNDTRTDVLAQSYVANISQNLILEEKMNEILWRLDQMDDK